MANEDGLVQINISLSKSQLPLLPELVNVLITARNSTYTWDSMKLCLQSTQSDDETGTRLVLNVTKSISDETELILGRLHRCNDNVCTHNSSENILGDVKMTTFINESFREYLRKESLEAVNINSRDWNSEEVFYPNWYDHIRRESMTPQDFLSDLTYIKTNIKRDSPEPIYFVNNFDGIPYVNHNVEHYDDHQVKTSGEESEEKARLRRIFNRAKGPLSKPSLEIMTKTFPKDDEIQVATPFENETRLNDDPKLRRNLLRLKETLDLPLSSDSEFNTVFVDNNRHFSLPQPSLPMGISENTPSDNMFSIDCNFNNLKGRYSEYNCKKKTNAEMIPRNQSNAEVEGLNKVKRNIKKKLSTENKRKSLMSYSASEISKRKKKESSEHIKVGTSKSKHNLKPSSSPHKRSTKFRKRSADVHAENKLNNPFSFVQKSKMIPSIDMMDSDTSLESICSKRSLKIKKKKSRPGKWFYKKDMHFEIEPLEPVKRKKKSPAKDIKISDDKKIVKTGAERILSLLIGGTGQSNEKFDEKISKLTAHKTHGSRNSLTIKKEKEIRFKDSELCKIRSENRKLHRERTPKKEVDSAIDVISDEIKIEKSKKDLSIEKKTPIKQNECDFKLMEKREEALTDKYLTISKKDPTKCQKSEKAYGEITKFWKKAFTQPKRAAVPGIPENNEATSIQNTTQKGTAPKKEISFLELLSVITEEVKHLGRRRDKKIKDQN